jgi:hypothetical protein
MDKSSEVLESTNNKKNIIQPIIELSESQPIKTSSCSIFSFFKYFSCTSSKPTVIRTQSLGDAIAQATLELQKEAQAQAVAQNKVVEQAQELAKAVEQAQVVEQALAEAEAEAKESILDPTTVELLIKVTDGVRVVTEKNKEEKKEKMYELSDV